MFYRPTSALPNCERSALAVRPIGAYIVGGGAWVIACLCIKSRAANGVYVDAIDRTIWYKRYFGCKLFGNLSDLNSISFGTLMGMPFATRIVLRSGKTIFLWDAPTQAIESWAAAVANLALDDGHIVAVSIPVNMPSNRYEFICSV